MSNESFKKGICSALCITIDSRLESSSSLSSDRGEETSTYRLFPLSAKSSQGSRIHSRCERMMDGKDLVGGEDTYKDALAHLRSR